MTTFPEGSRAKRAREHQVTIGIRLLAIASIAVPVGVPLAAAPEAGELKIYRSFDRDVDVEVALLSLGDPAKGTHLLRVRGASAPGQSSVRLCHAQRVGGQTRYVIAGTERTPLIDQGQRTLHQGTLHHYSTLHLGKVAVRVIYDKQASHRDDRAALLKAYLHAQRLDVTSRLPIERAIKGAAEAVRKACGNGAFVATHDWPAFEKQGLVPLAHASLNYLAPLATLCESDRDYRQRIHELKSARFTVAKQRDRHVLRVSKTTFFVELALEQPNTQLLGPEWLRDNL